MKKILRILLGIVGVSVAMALFMTLNVQLQYTNEIEPSVALAKPAPIAIVLGASVKLNGDPSPALQDRLETGYQLYEAGRVEKILITGDDGLYHIDEIHSMRRTLENLGVPEKDILEDGHGYRTYESCKRAVSVFGIDRAIVVTQRFHLSRALYLCNRLGIVATGVPADLREYDKIFLFTIRDYAASFLAWIDINVRAPKPPVVY
ncbi:MAG: YdcF family protein [bacterium]|nr:YdcF family protein [bacterium]